MERHVKERLVGAAVLVAAAVILIPEMLSSRPDRSPRDETAQAAGDAPLKTYTIDLTRSPAQQSQEPEPQSMPSTAAPPPEMPADPEPATADEAVAPTAQGIQEKPESESASPPAPTTDAPPAVRRADPPASAQTAPPVQPVPPPARTVPDQPAVTSGWAVQLGSFSRRATADGMVKKLQAQGDEAFVMPVKSGGATLYRVRIGPMKDRESAAKVLARIRTAVPAAAVVRHP